MIYTKQRTQELAEALKKLYTPTKKPLPTPLPYYLAAIGKKNG